MRVFIYLDLHDHDDGLLLCVPGLCTVSSRCIRICFATSFMVYALHGSICAVFIEVVLHRLIGSQKLVFWLIIICMGVLICVAEGVDKITSKIRTLY